MTQYKTLNRLIKYHPVTIDYFSGFLDDDRFSLLATVRYRLYSSSMIVSVFVYWTFRNVTPHLGTNSTSNRNRKSHGRHIFFYRSFTSSFTDSSRRPRGNRPRGTSNSHTMATGFKPTTTMFDDDNNKITTITTMNAIVILSSPSPRLWTDNDDHHHLLLLL